jgi:hypothetical protein
VLCNANMYQSVRVISSSSVLHQASVFMMMIAAMVYLTTVPTMRTNSIAVRDASRTYYTAVSSVKTEVVITCYPHVSLHAVVCMHVPFTAHKLDSVYL